jgi:SulP family sulfate permease
MKVEGGVAGIVRWLGVEGGGVRRLAGEIAAGCMGSLVSIAYCVSYAALIFAGPLSSGLGAVLWSLLAATALATLWIAATTTMPPAIAGPRNPTVAVLSVLAGGIASAASANGLPPGDVVLHAPIGLATATFLTGAALTMLGTFKLGHAVRFVPYPVIAGFLGASGWLLVVGGAEIALGAPWSSLLATGLPTADALARVTLALVFVAAVLLARANGAPAAVLPMLFFGSALVLDIVLKMGPERPGWYLAGASAAAPWTAASVVGAPVDWSIIAGAWVEIGAVVAVALMTLLLDVSQLAALRGRSSDLDREFASNGIANVAVAPIGGAPVGLAPNSSRLVEEAGGTSRLAGLAGGFLVLGALDSGIDIARLLPTPVLGGLVVLLGLGILKETLAGAPSHRAPMELALALAITLAIVRFGYLPGALLGLLAAAVLFAFRYSRIGVIRRHLTRATLGAAVERSAEDRALLLAEGHRIHVVWLTGYVFFGSSHRTWEAIRDAVGPGNGERRWVVLDMSGVTGLDASALLSFARLVDWAREASVEVAFAGLTPAVAAALDRQGLVDGVVARRFPTRNDALENAEAALLASLGRADPDHGDAEAAFARWLDRELGVEAREVVERYVERRVLAPGTTVCEQGEPSDSIELVVAGTIVVRFRDGRGREVPIRRVVGRTIVGEMGFFRRQPRAASVAAEHTTVLRVMTRDAWERLSREEPKAARRFLELIVRQLADRVELSTREIAALE